MAGNKFTAQTPEVTTGVTKKTVLQILAATNQRVLVKEISVSFDGVVNTDNPILVEVLRQSDAGSGGVSLTLQKLNPDNTETLQSTALRDISGSVQPTDTGEVLGEQVHPQGGYTWQAPFGGEIEVPGGERLGIAVFAQQAVNVKARIIAVE